MEGERLKFKAKDGKEYAVFVSQITYYRSYVESSSKVGDVPSLKTAVYLVGSSKAIIFPISFTDFDRKVNDRYRTK